MASQGEGKGKDIPSDMETELVAKDKGEEALPRSRTEIMAELKMKGADPFDLRLVQWRIDNPNKKPTPKDWAEIIEGESFTEEEYEKVDIEYKRHKLACLRAFEKVEAEGGSWTDELKEQYRHECNLNIAAALKKLRADKGNDGKDEDKDTKGPEGGSSASS